MRCGYGAVSVLLYVLRGRNRRRRLTCGNAGCIGIPEYRYRHPGMPIHGVYGHVVSGNRRNPEVPPVLADAIVPLRVIGGTLGFARWRVVTCRLRYAEESPGSFGYH